MKKIFWTTIFWVVIVALFWTYIRLFNQPLATKVAQFFVKAENSIVIWIPITWINLQDTITSSLSKIDLQTDLLAKTIQANQASAQQIPTPLPQSIPPTVPSSGAKTLNNLSTYKSPELAMVYDITNGSWFDEINIAYPEFSDAFKKDIYIYITSKLKK